MKNIHYFLMLFLGTFICRAQQPPNIVPPSPEAASLLKFTEVPVSLHTGVPNINIPLFEIESGGVTVPISISYHARGIKVAEVASRVGLGWTLNCGGLVSRQIRFSADEIDSSQRADFNGFFTNQYQDSIHREDEYSKLNAYDHPPASLYDAIPDQYYFNVNGLNGKFIYDYTDGEILVQQFSDIKLSAGGTTITDGQGNTYFFGAGTLGDYDRTMQSLTLNETSGYTITNPTPEPIYRNTWHLTKIKTQKGPEINFSYIDDESYFYRRTYDNYVQAFPVSQSGYKGFVSNIKSIQKMVSRIDFDKGYLTFEYESRYDVINGKRLKGITLYNTNNQIVRQVELKYQDVLSADDDNTHPNLKTLDVPARTRMYLKTVQFKYGTQTIPPYTFEYDDTPLPNRHSNSQDIWGYYNGKANGHCLKNDNEYTSLGHRTVDTIMASAGMLKKITYPEGGYTKFTYEHNKVFNPFPDDVVFDNPNPYQPANSHLSNIEYTDTNVYNAAGNYYKKKFTISSGVAGGWLKYTFQNSNFIYKILNINNIEIYNLSLIDTQAPNTENGTGQVTLSYLPPGDYFLEAIAPAGHNPADGDVDTELDSFTVHVDWIETTPDNSPILAAGKRIKKIEYRDPLNNQGFIKTYNYDNPDTGQTSGLLFGLPNFRSLEQTVTTIGGQEWQLFNWQGNFPGSPLVTYQEQSQGYGTVTEFNGEGGTTLGKTVHTFTMTPDMGEYYRFPLHPPTDNEYLRGKELTTTHYKRNTNGSFAPVKKIENEYLYADDVESTLYSFPYRKPIYEGLADSGYVKNRRRFRLPLALFYDGNVGHAGETDTIYPQMYKAYQLTGGTVDLKKTTVTDYYDNGVQVVNTTDYGYRYDYHYNLAQETKIASDGASVISKTFYPADPEMALKPVVADLISKNMRQIPLVSQSFRGSTKLSETETIFKDWHPDASKRVMEPEYVKTATGTDPSEYRLRFVDRDSINGNLYEVQQTNGTSVSYIWGYNKAYPIAKIENATYNTIKSYVTTLQTASDNGNLTQSSFTTLRNALPNAMVTTYTYNPFVGVTSITDPKGYTIYYDYDVFGRLIAVKDKDPVTGNFRLLSENKYNYRP